MGGEAVRIRPATRDDVPRLLRLIRDLANYEREPDAVVATEADLAEHLFGAEHVACCQVAVLDGAQSATSTSAQSATSTGAQSATSTGAQSATSTGAQSATSTGAQSATGNGGVVGFALWFRTFSTWRGKPGIHLEDLYVDPSVRRLGVARALLGSLRVIATGRGYGRIDWSVLDWNVDAQSFYRSIGATPMTEWTTWRLDLPTG